MAGDRGAAGTRHTSWVTDDELVTGEAVALALPPASVPSRMLSGLVDLLAAVVALIGLAVVWTGLFGSAGPSGVADAAYLLIVVGVVLGVPVTTETLTRGRTLGKIVVGLRTVRDDAGPITFRHALARGLAGVVEIYLLSGAPALVSAIVTNKGKRLGDIAAGTYVIRERVKVTVPPPVGMPPQLQQWAAGADIAALPDGLAAAVRLFLTSRGTLTPQAYQAVAQDLVTDVLRYVAPAPPAGTHVEVVLAAVLAERRRRDWLRLRREAELRARLVPDDRSL